MTYYVGISSQKHGNDVMVGLASYIDLRLSAP